MSYRWSRDYDEKSRPKEPNESWANSRYGPLNMNWSEAQDIYLPSVNKTVGKSWFHLRKLWERYKKNNRIGESNSDTAYQINLYQHALDIPRTEFEELIGLISEHEFEDSSESLESRPPEWSELDSQLLREEQQSNAEEESELDDW